ncbi:phage tail tape measure protein [Clostridium sp. HBUAS56010]|uniref:phage tail tape measure protein n=1 Tax=Clostridium sp. HBUAS56010 TaxID=2571127 RepID=UPI001178C166|nr:phage tail tape measure protein [Clostridium sp. HBUAS56010]
MASVQYALQVYDGSSKALKVIDESIQKAGRSLQAFQISASKSLVFPGMSGIRKNLDIIDGKYVEITDSISTAEKQQKGLNKSIEDGKKKTGDLKDVWKKLSKGFGSVTSKLGKLGVDTSLMDLVNRASSVKDAGNMIQAKTGMGGADLDMAKKSANNLYADHVSKSPEDAANSIASVQQMTGKTGAGLEQLTRAGLLMQDTFGYGLTDSIQSAGILEQKFGVTGAQAFDLIIQGTQSGLNKNGELLSTINTNADSFKKLGFSGQDMFNMLINGAASGNVSISTMGNAMNEFSTRVLGGGAEAKEAFSALGLNAESMQTAFAGGGETARAAFEQTIAALNEIEDPISRNAAGMQLFGSSFGELGQNGINAMADLNGSVELSTSRLEELNQIKYNNASDAIGSLVNTINLGLAQTVGNMVNHIAGAIRDFTTGLQGNVGEISGIFGGIGLVAGTIGGIISDSWSILEPVIWGAIAALIVYNSTAGLSWLTTLKGAAVMAWKTICDWAETAAIIAMIIAQNGLNAALAACPLTWIIILIIAIIALFFAAVAVFNKLAGTSVSATGIICGAFMGALAFIENILMAFVELVFGVIEFLVNPFIAFANFIGNLFDDPIGSIIHLFFDMADGVLSVIEKIAKAIDLVFGTKMAATVTVWRENLTSYGDKLADKLGNGKYERKQGPLDMDKVMADMNLSMNHISYGDNMKKGYEAGKGGMKSLKDGLGDFGSILKGKTDAFDQSAYSENPAENNPLSGAGIPESITKNTGDTAMNTAAMADQMDSMDEELKYMRDAAEQEIINRFTLADLKLDINNNNTIKNVADVDNVIRMLSDTTSEVLSSWAEGVNG